MKKVLTQMAYIGWSIMLQSRQLEQLLMIEEIEPLQKCHPEAEHPELARFLRPTGRRYEENWHLQRVELQGGISIVVVVKEDIYPDQSSFSLWEIHLFPKWKSHFKVMAFQTAEKGWWSGELPIRFSLPTSVTIAPAS